MLLLVSQIIMNMSHMHGACRYVFVEYGPLVIDINLCVRVHELRKALEERVCLLHPSPEME